MDGRGRQHSDRLRNRSQSHRQANTRSIINSCEDCRAIVVLGINNLIGFSVDKSLKKKIKKSHFFWRYGLNLQQTLLYQHQKKRKTIVLTSEEQSILGQLNNRGIGFSSVEALFGNRTYLNGLVKIAAELKASSAPDRESGEKGFVRFLLGLKPTYEAESFLAQFSHSPAFQRIADAYYGMANTEMRYYNVWENIPTKQKPTASQLWHRDREDLQILKIFVYLNKVDDGAGPLTYAPGTHIKGAIRRDPEFFLEGHVRRSTDNQMSKIVPSEQWFKAIVSPGTIVFADTHGYHKGGYSTEHSRLLFTCMYVSPACERTYFSKS